jgi:uncharacterized protein
MALFDKLGQVFATDITKDFRLKRNADQENSELSFVEQLNKRRTVKDLGNKLKFSQSYITKLIQEAVRSCPSAHNSQSTRVVILYGESHLKFWEIVKEMQRKIVPANVFAGTALKIERCSKAYGTVLFYEDQTTIKKLQKLRPFDADEFPIWSEQTSGMAQFAVWAALAESEIGAALQHYNPIVDEEIAMNFGINPDWKLRAQLVFGSIEQDLVAKPY